MSYAIEAQRADPGALADLSLEDLTHIEITSVAKRPQKLSEAASAIYVITQQDIRRSGAHNIADALRLAPNLQVARIGANQFAVSARGFNSNTANKLQVLIDGRSVYTPLYAGVFWDVQDVVMEDIERIEVISGPGATLWGSNAVNGIVNVITRGAHATQGTLGSVDVGTDGKAAAVRYGGTWSANTSYRVYAKASDYAASVNGGGVRLRDASRLTQAGFRIDAGRAANELAVQGDLYTGSSEQPILDKRAVGGGNLLARWNHRFEEENRIQVLAYYDHTKRVYPGLFGEILDTFSVEMQHQFTAGKRNDIVWGGAYRFARDQVENSAALAFVPAQRSLRNYSAFMQDQIDIVPGTLDLTLGSKFEHNEYSGLDIQPTVRLAWKVSQNHNLWGAVSKAARAPSRIDTEFYAPAAPPYTFSGGPNFLSETVTAYELGYRGQLSARTTLAASGFYNVYRRLRNLEKNSANTLVLSNRMSGESTGVEVWAETRPSDQWRLQLGYTLLRENLRLPADSTDPLGIAAAGNDPGHQFSLRSSVDVRPNIEWDVALRRVGKLPHPQVPAYTGLDMRLAWKANKQWSIALIGRDLLKANHPEFVVDNTPTSMVSRSLFVKAIWITL